MRQIFDCNSKTLQLTKFAFFHKNIQIFQLEINMEMFVPHKTYLVKYVVVSSLYQDQFQDIHSHCQDTKTLTMFEYLENDLDLMNPLHPFFFMFRFGCNLFDQVKLVFLLGVYFLSSFKLISCT